MHQKHHDFYELLAKISLGLTTAEAARCCNHFRCKHCTPYGYATSTRPHTIGCGRPQSEEASTCLHARLTESYHPNGQTNDPARSRSQGHRSRLTQSDTLMAPCGYYTSLSLRSGNQQILTGLLHRVLARCLSEGPAISAKFQTGRRQSSENHRKKLKHKALPQKKQYTQLMDRKQAANKGTAPQAPKAVRR